MGVRGRHLSAATRKKISVALLGRHRGGGSHRKKSSVRERASRLNAHLEARMINEKFKADQKTAAKKRARAAKKASKRGRGEPIPRKAR